MAEIEEVPCNIIDITDTQSAEIALLENLQREDLNFIEEAEAYYNLIHDHKFTQEELANRMGKKQSTIANKLRLLKLSLKVRELCIEHKLTERHARALLSLPDEELQLKIIDKIIKESLNVKATEEAINKELLKLAGEELNKRIRKRLKAYFLLSFMLIQLSRSLVNLIYLQSINLRTMMTLFKLQLLYLKNNT